MSLSIVLCLGTLVFSWFVTRKVFRAVRNVKATICGAFESAPHSCTNAGGTNTYIKNALEWAALPILVLDMVFLSINFFLALEGPPC